jgi:hypothetical protein
MYYYMIIKYEKSYKNTSVIYVFFNKVMFTAFYGLSVIWENANIVLLDILPNGICIAHLYAILSFSPC